MKRLIALCLVVLCMLTVTCVTVFADETTAPTQAATQTATQAGSKDGTDVRALRLEKGSYLVSLLNKEGYTVKMGNDLSNSEIEAYHSPDVLLTSSGKPVISVTMYTVDAVNDIISNIGTAETIKREDLTNMQFAKVIRITDTRVDYVSYYCYFDDNKSALNVNVFDKDVKVADEAFANLSLALSESAVARTSSGGSDGAVAPTQDATSASKGATGDSAGKLSSNAQTAAGMNPMAYVLIIFAVAAVAAGVVVYKRKFSE